ncbi:MAG: hypothetical protein ACO1SX_12990 [Actinomycetota bacterium]
MPDDLPLLRRHLSVSSAWKLTEEDQQLVAVRRERADESTPEAGKLRMTADGFYFKHQPWRRYRVRLALGAAPAAPAAPDAEWQAIRVDAKPGMRDVLLTVQPVTSPDFRSYLVVSGENSLFLEILEESMDAGRESTRRLLREANEELEKLLELNPEDKPADTLEGLTPAGSTSTAPPVLRVEKVARAAGYHVYGYVNPGSEGVTYLRAYDAAGAELDPATVRAQTLEHVGWSPNAKTKYFFNSRLPLGEASPALGRAELWFQPSPGGPARKLLEAKPQ